MKAQGHAKEKVKHAWQLLQPGLSRAGSPAVGAISRTKTIV